jgi:DNA-directed RNA polymerase specialized sigma24 family protein
MTPSKDTDSFLTTRWTRVALAKADSEDGRVALADLCASYYEPVVTFLRCKLGDSEAARELSHAFFSKMLEGGTIAMADEKRGRFRSYLLGAVKHFLSNHLAAEFRQKRGGGLEGSSIHEDELMDFPDKTQLSPDAAFDRQWAVTVLAHGLDALRQECGIAGRASFFEIVKPLLTGDSAHGDQAAMAAACGMNLAAFRMALHRLKKRLRDCVKKEVAGTLDDPGMVQEEMRTLFTALGG